MSISTPQLQERCYQPSLLWAKAVEWYAQKGNYPKEYAVESRLTVFILGNSYEDSWKNLG